MPLTSNKLFAPQLQPPLERSLRQKLEKAVRDARDIAEKAAKATLNHLGVGEGDAKKFAHLRSQEKELRKRLRTHGRQLGDQFHSNNKTQELDRLIEEVAYEHWHRMLFARFLAENNLLMYPDPTDPVPVSLEECEDLAADEGAKSGWELAARYASQMLPQIFRQDSPVFQLILPQEYQRELEQIVNNLAAETFTAGDSLGWVYQFWQAKRKDEVNASEVKIGARELPAVTQLFTENYMVSFLLDNSLGAWWAGKRLSASDLQDAQSEEQLRQKASLPGVPLSYLRFIKATTNPDLRASAPSAEDNAEENFWQPASGTFPQWPQNISELKLLDPCCGSGHFLVAALRMLVPMRMELEGLTARDAVDAVLRDNIHGLEIDRRCVELAAFNLALAAWTYQFSSGREVEGSGYHRLPELQVACSGLSISLAKEEWKQLALDKHNLRIAMDWMHQVFSDAPTLGSLLDPSKTDAAKIVNWEELSASLTQALKAEPSDDQQEAAVVAQGLAKAATMMSDKYHLVNTNVPYLARGKQSETLAAFCERYYKDAKNDLATVFLDRCLAYCHEGGTVSLVLPQNWLFLTSYKKLRERLLRQKTWHLLARLGPGAFDTISGEVVKAILLCMSAQMPALSQREMEKGFLLPLSANIRDEDPLGEGVKITESSSTNEKVNEASSLGKNEKVNESSSLGTSSREPKQQQDAATLLRGIDVAEEKTATAKAEKLLVSEIQSVEQARQLENPDARVVIHYENDTVLLNQYAYSHHGLTSGDMARMKFAFWELIDYSKDIWIFYQGTVSKNSDHAGNEYKLRWQNGHGAISELQGARKDGTEAWGECGVLISQMRELYPAIYNSYAFDNNTAVITPNNKSHLPAIWCYCSSPEYNQAVRSIDQSLKVTNATLVKVPFDLDHWTKVANEKYPNGLPEPYTNDPTQWIFHGHPCGNVYWDETAKWTAHGELRLDDTVLQIAVARLLGYHWPAEQDDMELAAEQREWVKHCEALLSYADEDGIVCIPPVRGEAAAADRLLDLLAAAYGDSWSGDIMSRLLEASDHAGKTLETWLREKFFTQHCKLFHHRPFIWQIWDGLRDGFSALVNYHKLDYKNLETLVYTYLGDWINRQKQDIAGKVDGSQEKLAAAEKLQKSLELILQGEKPYDIFVRWKPLAEQPLGWNPDLNDGVRLNIRPFLSVPDVGKRDAGILRDKPNIKWTKDRGKDVESAPWYNLGLKYGGNHGDRINDHHLSLDEKRKAREGK